MCSPDGENPSSPPSNGHNRRAFRRTAGLAGAGAAAFGAMTAGQASAASAASLSSSRTREADSGSSAFRGGLGTWDPNPESPRFTLAVMPDTQFLYWGSQGSVNPEPQEESFPYVLANSGSESGNNIVFMSHLGDLTEDAEASSFQYVSQAFDILDSQGVAYSVLAGNHDVSGD